MKTPKRKVTQISMFTQGEDLPLFTGTAPNGQVIPYQKEAQLKTEPLPFQCRFCRDTGRLGDHAFCWCEVGVQARQLKIKENILIDARALSSGTVAGLIGNNRYDAIEAAQAAFIIFVTENDIADCRNWQQVWEVFYPQYRGILASSPLRRFLD